MVPYDDDDDDQDLTGARTSRRRRRGGRRRSGTAVTDDPPIMPRRVNETSPAGGGGASFPLGRWLLIALAVVLAYQARDVWMLLIIALLFAHVLTPVVDVLACIHIGRRMIPRTLAASVVMLAALAALGVFVSTLVPVLISDLAQLLARAPAYLRTTQDYLDRLRSSSTGMSLPDNWWVMLDAALNDQIGKLAGVFGHGAVSLLSHVVQLAGLVVVPIIAFHLLRDGRRFTAWMVSLVPAERRLGVLGVVRDIDSALAAYVRGQTLVCAMMGVAVGVALTIIGFPYAPLLGAFAGLAEAVPYVGALVIEILLVVIGLSVSPALAVIGPVVYFVLNQILGMTVTPHLMGRRLNLHPVVVILAVFAGGSLAGFVGMLLALPAAAIGQVLLDRWRTKADAPS